MTNETVNNEALSSSHHPVPSGLWNMVRLGFLGIVLVGIGLVIAVTNGLGDPQPVGSLRWEDHFTAANLWATFGQGAAFNHGALEIQLGPDLRGGAVALNSGNGDSAYSFEAAGGQVSGPVGAAYGIVFDYQNPTHYTVVLINGNGYVQVLTADGHELMAWQQWPNILLEYEANRIRVDVQNGEGLIRINDEVLLTVPVAEGRVGVFARGSAASQTVRFGWAKYWSR